MTIRRQLLNFGSRSTDLRMGSGAFEQLPKLLAGAVGKPQRALMLHGGSEDGALVEDVRRALVDAGFSVDILSIAECSAAEFASLQSVLLSCEHAQLTGEDLLVGMGSARVCSLASMASRMWMGQLSCVLLPTTLDAMITCATATEPLTLTQNCSFAPVQIAPEPALVVCDLDLVRSAAPEHNGMGFVRMIAAHLCESRKAWESFETHIDGLLAGDEISYLECIGMALTSRLNTVKSVSPAARKAYLYGQTTAHALCACLGSDIPAYQLLAEGMRFEARLGVEVFDFSVDAMFAQDDYLADLGVEELTFQLDVPEFIAALNAERHRFSNRFQLALPKNLGIIRLAGIDDDVLERHAQAFLASRAE